MRDRIERIELFHVDVPLPTPFFPLWVRGFPQRNLRYTLLAIHTKDGLVGHATGAAFDRERAGLGDFIGPFLLGLDPYDHRAAAERLEQAAFLGWRNHWMEVAFWDLAAQARGVPMWQLIAEAVDRPRTGATPERLPAYASFGEFRTADARAEAIERVRRLGFRSAKVGLDAASEAEDVALIRAARAAGGDDFELLVHAYQARRVSLVEDHPRWDLSRALSFADHASSLGVAWLQEPLPIWSTERTEDLAALAGRSPVPLVGGDISTSVFELESLVARGLYKTLTPDVSFTGMAAAVRLMRICLERGAGFSPRTYGDGVSLVANMHALAAWSAQKEAAGPMRFELPWEPPAMMPTHRDALFEKPIDIDLDGMVSVPSAPGLGVPIDPKALRRFGHRFYTLTPVRFAVTARRTGLADSAGFVRTPRPSRRRRVASA